MAQYKLNRKAEGDLRAIAAFTVDTFGIAQARAYRDGLLTLLIASLRIPKLALPSPIYFKMFAAS
jgi:plasmid stabilization system protein ParE